MASQKIEYGSSAAVTITLASLASDTNLLAGRESTAIDNTSSKFLDYLVAGRITTGTSPTASRNIEVWCYAQLEDTPTYPDVFDGSDSNETITNVGIKNAVLKLVASIGTTNSSNVAYDFGPVSVASLFGGVVPKRFGFFVVHNTAVNLNSTGGNHAIWVTPIYSTLN